MRYRTFRYANCESLNLWLAAGWLVVGHYRSWGNNFESFILEWKCDCEPGTPRSMKNHLTGGQGAHTLVPMIATPTSE